MSTFRKHRSGAVVDHFRRLIQEIHPSIWQILGIYLVSGWVAYQVIESLIARRQPFPARPAGVAPRARAILGRASRRIVNPTQETGKVARKGTVLLNYVALAPARAADEGRRIFASHGPWMEATHDRSGEKAPVSHDVAIGPELSNPLDPGSQPTRRPCFVLTEVYEPVAGVDDHFSQATSSWDDFPAVGLWLQKREMRGLPAAPIVNSLW